MSSSVVHLANSCHQGSDWNVGRKSGVSNRLASLSPFGSHEVETLGSPSLLATCRCPDTHNQKWCSWGFQVICPASCLWSNRPNVKVSSSPRVVISIFWLKRLPKDKLRRPEGHFTHSTVWLNWSPKVRVWRSRGKLDVIETLVKLHAENQTL